MAERTSSYTAGEARRFFDARRNVTNQTLFALFQCSPVATLVLDGEGRITMWNLAAERLFGWREQEVLGRLPSFSAEGRDDLLHLHERALAGEELSDVEVRCQKKDGSTLDVGVSAARLCGRGEGSSAVMISMADITARKQADQLRDEYASLISHDLRNPLTAVMGQASWLRRSLAEKGLEREAGNADAIVQSARRMNSMIQDLMESARLESGRLELRRQPADLRLLLDDLCHRLGSTEDQLRLRVECPEWAPPLPIDRERLERALENIVTNALKYSPADSPVTVRVEWREVEAA